jgi:hypothetical protein
MGLLMFAPGEVGVRPGVQCQAVACAAHALQHVRALDGRQGSPEALNVDVHRALLNEDMVTPDAVEQLGAAVHALRVGHEEVQHSELGRPHAHFTLGEVLNMRQAVQNGVKPEVAKVHAAVQRLRCFAPQHGTHAGHQLIG